MTREVRTEEFKHIMPAYDRNAVIKFVENDGRNYARTVSRKVLFRNLGRMRTVSPDDPCLFLFNHTTMKDYPASQYALIKAGLPPTRVVGGANLNNWLFRTLFGLDFSDYGMFWYDKTTSLRVFEATYFPPIRKLYENGESIAFFPEGTRNRNPEKGLLPLKTGFIRGVLAAADELGLDMKVVHTGMHHEVIPERMFYWLTDSGPKGGFRYYLGDALAHFYGRRMRDKGVSVISFGEPYALRELAGKGDIKERARNVANVSREILRGLYEEARS